MNKKGQNFLTEEFQLINAEELREIEKLLQARYLSVDAKISP